MLEQTDDCTTRKQYTPTDTVCGGFNTQTFVADAVGHFRYYNTKLEFADLGPVVQSIVSLTSSLRGQLVKCFTIL